MGDTSKQAQARRLKQARLLRYEHGTDAAEALGLNRQTYLPYENENGRTGFRHRAPHFAQFFGVNLEWLLTGDGPMLPSAVHPVLEIFEKIPPEKQARAIEYLQFLAVSKN